MFSFYKIVMSFSFPIKVALTELMEAQDAINRLNSQLTEAKNKLNEKSGEPVNLIIYFHLTTE